MKIYAFIQARMGSTRFPGKVLAPLNGRPVIEYVFRFAKGLPVDKVFLLTSSLQEDDVLVEWANNSGIPVVYRGDAANVAKRFYDALTEWPCDYALRICGDSPFLDQLLAYRLIDAICQHPDADYYGYADDETPAILTAYGLFIEGFRTEAFRKMYEAGLIDTQKEHVTNVFYQNWDRYTSWRLDIPPEIMRHPFKASIDTVADLHRTNLLAATLEAEKEPGYWDIAHAVAGSTKLQTEDAIQQYDWR